MPRITYHLVALSDWPGDEHASVRYAPASLAAEGFVHCTDGLDAVVATANRYYAADARPYLLVALDLDRVGSPWRYDDDGRVFPHVYGPIDLGAVVSLRALRRADDGRFLGVAEDAPSG